MVFVLGGIYAVLLSFILFYSFAQIGLVRLYLKNRKEVTKQRSKRLHEKDEAPVVTVQLPVFNEKYVVERLIDAVCAFDYPKDKLEIQVLDDSTDDSFEIAAKKIKEKREEGFNINHVKRPDRVGFKAGALKYGMERARGQFIAIFDADFLPEPDFLKCTLPYFGDSRVGVVQTKWGHINLNYSLITRLQGLALNAHFTVEQLGRNIGGHFINFNGTAGVWRKEAIEDAGGWQSDTLTEDLDLSYRAQNNGWKFVYLENKESPAELPVEMNALKTQQFRWTKGAAECARKNLRLVFANENLSLGTKIHAFFHLMNSAIFICIVLTALLTLPLVYLMAQAPEYNNFYALFIIFHLAFVLLMIYYYVSYTSIKKGGIRTFLKFFFTYPVFLSISMGLSLYNAIGVAQGYLGKKSPFIRTPKFNVKKKGDRWSGNIYKTRRIDWITVFEGLLALIFTFGIWMTFHYGKYTAIPYMMMLSFGFGFVFFVSLKHAKRR